MQTTVMRSEGYPRIRCVTRGRVTRKQEGNTTEATARRCGAFLLLLCIAGCASIGPRTVPRDRVDYITALADSWKEQTLLNIVRLRYGDTPTFLDVSSIISGYAFQGQMSAGGQVTSGATTTIPSGLATLGGTATYLDRPTISYTPLTGDKFARSLLQPIPPSAIFELIQAGYPADYVLLLTARAINGIYNRSSVGMRVRHADPEFYPLLEALRRLQISGAVNLRLEKHGQEQTGTLILAGKRSAEVERDLQYVDRILNIKPSRNGELKLVFGALPRDRGEIALLSRSMMEILLEVAAGIHVPKADVAQGRTSPAPLAIDASNPLNRVVIQIHSGPVRPVRPFTAAEYRGTWYWISDRDLASKRIFTFLMMFFSLAERGAPPPAPVLTLPVN